MHFFLLNFVSGAYKVFEVFLIEMGVGVREVGHAGVQCFPILHLSDFSVLVYYYSFSRLFPYLLEFRFSVQLLLESGQE